MATERTCVHCGGTDDVQKRELRLPEKGQQARFDVCARCRSTVPLAEFDALVESGRRRRITRRVFSEEEVAKMAKHPRRSVKR